MKYKVIHSEFGGQPLAGYLMNVIDLTRNKDGCDAISFLEEIDKFVNKIFEQSEIDDFMLKEFFFGIRTDEDSFTMDFVVNDTFDECARYDFVGSFYSKELTKYYRMYTENEDWGFDEIELVEENDVMDTEYKVMETINCECYSDFYDQWFAITKDMGRAENRIMFLNALYEAEPKGNNKAYVGFKYEDINDVIETSDYLISEDVAKVSDMPLIYMNEFNPETGIHYIKRIQFEEPEYDLVEVEVNRIRKVLEKAIIKVAVAKSFGEDAKTEAENYITNSFCGANSLDWEIEDDEYEFEDLEIGESEISDTDTIDNLESVNDIDATLD